jgi:hypothetical protein
MKEENRSTQFENRVLRRMCGHKREEVKGWEKTDNVGPHNLYSSSYILDESGGACDKHGGRGGMLT